jgi:hypothetical protein
MPGGHPNASLSSSLAAAYPHHCRWDRGGLDTSRRQLAGWWWRCAAGRIDGNRSSKTMSVIQIEANIGLSVFVESFGFPSLDLLSFNHPQQRPSRRNHQNDHYGALCLKNDTSASEYGVVIGLGMCFLIAADPF